MLRKWFGVVLRWFECGLNVVWGGLGCFGVVWGVSTDRFSVGAQWLSGRVLDLRPRGCGFEPHRRHCVVVLEQNTSILA